MRSPGLYRFAIRSLPHRRVRLKALTQSISRQKAGKLEDILNRHRALGGALVLFDREGIRDHFIYGDARKGTPVDGGTAFRLASVSKLMTAAGIIRMMEMGAVSLDDDADASLPYSLRHPGAPSTSVTLRMLLTHTAGIHDGAAYLRGLTDGATAAELLADDSHTRHLPGEGCEYSNFGVGLAACVVESRTGLSFECAMQEYLFRPLGMEASYYPSRLSAALADARRIMPPSVKPAFDAAARQARQVSDWNVPDPQLHWNLAHGNCCMDAASAAALGMALIGQRFFKPETLAMMTGIHARLGSRDPSLGQGIGMFVLGDGDVCPYPLYGHQGMAYGAVHMLFLDMKNRRGILSLTGGASEARRYIMADLNRALLKAWLSDE